MRIKTITCHDVYNHGASLQAFALQEYLSTLGHDVEIINYKPNYLSQHYKFCKVSPGFQKNIVVKILYILAKLPSRLLARKRKRCFDKFNTKYLKLTKRYSSNEELKADVPLADVYIVGSDQVWNPIFENGRDPAFFLDFVPANKEKVAYAASFAVEVISTEVEDLIKPMLKNIDRISVRENSGITILQKIGIRNASVVLDPVFLLSIDEWRKLFDCKKKKRKYILVYTFEISIEMTNFIKHVAKERGLNIYSVNANKCNFATRSFQNYGPDEFLNLIHNAELVITNSFHATAFSLIFCKDFFVFERKLLNSRMSDLLKDLNIENCIREGDDWNKLSNYKINYKSVTIKLQNKINLSKSYLNECMKEEI